MKILAVEFSSTHRSVAVLEGATVLGTAMETHGHRGIGLVEQALKLAHSAREEIGVIAVGLGPGSYNGIRGAIALAQGWQLGRGINLLGISSVDCVASSSHAAGLRGPVNIIIDAQRNEFYLARCEITANAWREIEPLRLATHSEIELIVKSQLSVID